MTDSSNINVINTDLSVAAPAFSWTHPWNIHPSSRGIQHPSKDLRSRGT